MDKTYLPKKIKGTRISLKTHTIDLAPKMFEYIDEDRTRLSQFLPWPNNIKTVADEIKFINGCIESYANYKGAHYGIYRNEDDEYMGNISPFSLRFDHCSCEIGYWILGKFEGKGYMSEAVALLENALYETGFNRIVIKCDPNNERSRSIPTRMGYQLEGVMREVTFVNEKFSNLELYSKLKSEFLINNP